MSESEPLLPPHKNENDNNNNNETIPLVQDIEYTPVLDRKLTSRQLNMITIGGTIGTGLFLGSGTCIAIAGPLGSLLSFGIIGILVYIIVGNLGEMVTLFPIPGSFNTFAGRFVDPAFEFTLGWNCIFFTIVFIL